MSQFFAKEKSPETKAYVESFIPTMHTKIVNEAQASVEGKIARSSCSSSSDISFPESLTSKVHFDSKDEFEANFIKVATYDCLGKVNINKVFETLMSESYQRKAINGLQSIKLNQAENQTCVEVHIFGLGSSHYCVTQDILRTENQYIIHSYNDDNIGSPDTPIYFKETITVITQLPSGDASIYTLMYARGPELSFRGVIHSKIEEQQASAVKFLIEGSK
ncbi:hypothetical protein CIK05_13345 [Bdellovibrio sp. qaytius]|nr:hypothetical protein CIK05_13345 [Bdellovibrio sp. qaytius]